tara:strand:+ start:269 stop:547 length:279 start_codon:yes stop_codon:yes gene_type:complete
MYQDDLVKSAKSLRKYLKKMKPTDEYVRGYNDAKTIIDEVLGDIIEVLKDNLYCDECGEYPAEHTNTIVHNFNNYDNEYVEICNNCKERGKE